MFAVLGVTGNTGKAVAELLLNHDHPVRAVVRDPKKAAAWKEKGAELFQASVDDAAALTRAFQGVEGAYVLVPPQYAAEDLLAAQRPITDAIARAAKESAIPHLVLLSSVGAQHSEGTGPIRSLHHSEKAIGNAVRNLTILRAAYFMENWGMVLGEAKANGVLPSFLTPARRIPMIATRDIGRTAAEALLDPPRGRRVIELDGPAEYAPEDVARAVGERLGRAVLVQGVPSEAIVPTLTAAGFTAGTAKLFREMIEGINRGHVAWEGGAALRRHGTLTPGEALAPFLAGPATGSTP